jgi:hypothetical protein
MHGERMRLGSMALKWHSGQYVSKIRSSPIGVSVPVRCLALPFTSTEDEFEQDITVRYSVLIRNNKVGAPRTQHSKSQHNGESTEALGASQRLSLFRSSDHHPTWVFLPCLHL